MNGNEYTIIRKLGEGGFSAVYEVRFVANEKERETERERAGKRERQREKDGERECIAPRFLLPSLLSSRYLSFFQLKIML